MSGPVVHCITTVVTAGRVADALAAVGAQPILASAPEEAAAVTAGADALVLNCGTPTAGRFEAMSASLAAARAKSIPVVLDPVGCGASPWRTAHTRSLARGGGIALLRGNAAEIASCAGIAEVPILRGVSAAAADLQTLERIAEAAATALGCAVLVTGRGHDVLCAENDTRRLASDGRILGHVVGAGDVLTALCGASLATERSPVDAAVHAHERFSRAAAGAGSANGPGSFWPAFIDGLRAHG